MHKYKTFGKYIAFLFIDDMYFEPNFNFVIHNFFEKFMRGFFRFYGFSPKFI